MVSKSLGHSDLGVTNSVYGDVTPAMRAQSGARMTGILARPEAAAV